MDIISLKHPDKAVPFCRANDVYLGIFRKMDGTRVLFTVMAQECREQLLLRGKARSGVPSTTAWLSTKGVYALVSTEAGMLDGVERVQDNAPTPPGHCQVCKSCSLQQQQRKGKG